MYRIKYGPCFAFTSSPTVRDKDVNKLNVNIYKKNCLIIKTCFKSFDRRLAYF